MLESKFQSNLIKEIKDRYSGSVVLKNDSSYLQGIPDLSVYYKDKYAMLEVKKNEKASHQPNQDYYVNKIGEMGGFASFIYPENKDEVLNKLDSYFKG